MTPSRQHPPLELLKSLENESHVLEKNASPLRPPYPEKRLAAAKPRSDLRGDPLYRFSQSLPLQGAVLPAASTPRVSGARRVFCPVRWRFEMSLASPVRPDGGHCQFAV